MQRGMRIQVRFTAEEYDIIKRLAAVTHTTMSKALRMQIEAVLPVLAKVVETLEAANRAQGTARAKLVAHALRVHQELDEVAAQALDQFDMFTDAAKGAADASASSAEGAATGAKRSRAKRATGSAGTSSRGRVKSAGKRKRARG